MRKGTVRDILSFSRFWYQSIAMRVYDQMAQTRVQYLRQKPSYSSLNTRVARCPEIIFRDTGTFSYFLLCPCSSVILDDVNFNNCIIPRARAV